MNTETISLTQITVDDSLQVREYIDLTTVDSYRALMESNGPLGLLDVFSTGNGKYLLANRWHRLEAAEQLGWKEIDCEVHTGDKRDAQLFAIRANTYHGRHLTREERRRAVRTLLEDREWFHWSNAKIARHCGLSAPTVASIRDAFINEEALKSADSRASLKNSLSDKRTRMDKYGNVSTINTTNIGRRPQTQAEKNLADLNGALDTLARLPFGGQDAVELYGDRITDEADAAIEFATDLGNARA